jgi:hypothetical protein
MLAFACLWALMAASAIGAPILEVNRVPQDVVRFTPEVQNDLMSVAWYLPPLVDQRVHWQFPPYCREYDPREGARHIPMPERGTLVLVGTALASAGLWGRRAVRR